MAIATGLSNELNFRLLKCCRETEKDKNIFFSPFSIATALVMLYGGTRGNTKKQIEILLNLKENNHLIHNEFQSLFDSINTSSNNVINVGNMLALDKNFDVLPEFVANLKTNYSVDIKQYDFKGYSDEARKDINKCIEIITKEKIIDLFPPCSISPNTKLTLINTIYFKGMWSLPFYKNRTERKPFYTISQEELMVDMMYKKETYKYFHNLKLKATLLEIPYIDYDYAMVVILPDDKYGLPDIENNISVNELNNEFDKLAVKREVHLSFPKFKLEENLELKQELINLGLTDVFTFNADLSGISGKQDLCLSSVIHRAVLDINEEGTEAAAATAFRIYMKRKKIVQRFVVDHPFMFVIRNVKTGIILFTGSIYQL